MSAELSAVPRPAPGWLPRSILSGFIASMAMLISFFVAYGAARVAASVTLADRRGAETFHEWVQALTNNQVLDLATGSVYAAGAVHLTVGVLWAVVYAYYFEPRLPGAGWLRGLVFAFIPWVLSLVVFMPVVGGGFVWRTAARALVGLLPTAISLLPKAMVAYTAFSLFLIAQPITQESNSATKAQASEQHP